MQQHERFANYSYLELLYLNDRTSQVGHELNRHTAINNDCIVKKNMVICSEITLSGVAEQG